MRLSAPIFRLKRTAKLLARDSGIALHTALDRIAAKEGFHSWSHLASHYNKPGAAVTLLQSFSPGDLVLLGARPGQGKTHLALDLLCEAVKLGRPGIFFTLDYTPADILRHLRILGAQPENLQPLFQIDTSDDICADSILSTLRNASDGAVAVVDYLQLLDQKRDKPPLQDQIHALQEFAQARGTTLVFISQIARSFDLQEKSLPDLGDVRLPNPLDLNLFSKSCFLHEGEICLNSAA